MPKKIAPPPPAVTEDAQESSFGELNQGDLRSALCAALQTKVAAEMVASGSGSCCNYCSIRDVFDTFVVTQEWDRDTESYWKRSFTLSGNTATIGDREDQVEKSWVPLVAGDAADSDGGSITEIDVYVEAVAPDVTPELPSVPSTTFQAVESSAPEMRARESICSFRAAAFESEVDGEFGIIRNVIPIQPGLSVNRKDYPADVLRRDMGVFEGMACFYDHQEPGKPKELKSLLGRHENVRWDEALGCPLTDIRYPLTSQALVDDIQGKAKLFGAESVGMSIDLPVKAKLSSKNGQACYAVEALIHDPKSSTDAVWRPSAGGRFPAMESETEEDAMLKGLENLTAEELRAARPDLFAGIPATPAAAPPPASDAPVQQVQEAATDISAMVAAETARQMGALRAEANLEARLARMSFPDRVKKTILTNARECAFDTNAIETDIQEWARSFGAQQIFIPGTRPAEVVAEAAQKNYMRLAGAIIKTPQELNGERIKPFTSIVGAVTAFHPELRDSAIDNPRRFFNDAMGMLHWGGGELGRAQEVRAQESIQASTFAIAWADVMYKTLLANIADPELNTWRQLVSNNIPVSDLTKTRKLVEFGDFGIMSDVLEFGPYQELAAPSDRQSTLSVGKKGNIVSVSWESLLNDDLNILAQIPAKLGLAYAWTIYQAFFTLLTSASGDGATMTYDSTALYDSGRTNNTNTALTPAAYLASAEKMRAQVDFSSSLPKRFKPTYLLYASNESLKAQVWEMLTSIFKIPPTVTNAGEVNLPNWFKQYGLTPVEVYYPNNSTARVEILANPANCPTFATGFLHGMEEPEIFVQDMQTVGSVFNADVITYKLRGTFGAQPLDHRSFSRISK